MIVKKTTNALILHPPSSQLRQNLTTNSAQAGEFLGIMVNYVSPRIVDCPRCDKSREGDEQVCSVCGLSLEALDQLIGTDHIRLEPLTCPIEVMTEEVGAGVRSQISDFQKAFPPLRVVIFLSDLPSEISLRELMYWLLNRGVLLENRGEVDCRYVLLIGVALNQKEVGINAGDGALMKFPALESCMQQAVESLAGYLKVVSVDLALKETLENLQRCLSK